MSAYSLARSFRAAREGALKALGEITERVRSRLRRRGGVVSDVSALRSALLEARARLVDAGVLVGANGAVSARAGDRVVLAQGRGSDDAHGAADEAGLTIAELASGRCDGPRPPELELHLAIYRKRKDAGAVVRVDAPFASTVAAARREVPPVLEELAQLAGPTVRVASPARLTIEDLADAALAAMRGRRAALLADRGAVCLARDLDEAVVAAQVLERGCRTFVEAHFLGGASRLSWVEARLMHQFYLRRYSKVWKGQKA